MQYADEPDEAYGWYLDHAGPPRRPLTAVARRAGVDYALVLRAASRWHWRHRMARDRDLPAPAHVHAADVPVWLRPPGWSDQEWAWFAAWLRSPDHNLAAVANAFAVPEWAVRQAARQRDWWTRLRLWQQEKAQHAQHTADTALLSIKESLMAGVQSLATEVPDWLRRASVKTPDKAVEAFVSVAKLAADIVVPRPPMVGTPLQGELGSAELVMQQRAMQAQDLAGVAQALLPSASSGDRETVRTLIAVQKRQAELLGLDEPPITRMQVEAAMLEAGEQNAVIAEFIEERARELAEQMVAARDTPAPSVVDGAVVADDEEGSAAAQEGQQLGEPVQPAQ